LASRFLVTHGSKDLALRLLRIWGLTERTSRESIWNDVFSSISGTAQVGLKDGRNIIGWISRYSDSGDERSLFLESAYWVDENGSTIAINGKGILLTDRSEIEYVMFLNDEPDASSALK
jgi:protein involved in temperature-dependent protein secretion